MTIARRVRGGMLALGLIAGLSNFAICQEPKAPEAQPAIPLAPVLTKRYTWAEVESAMVLVRELRATTPQVQSSLNEWYNLIADPNFTESQDVPEHCVKLGVWTKSRPDSPIPLLAQGKARLNHAWHLRGNGFSSEVSATGQEAFRAELVKSREFIEQAIKLGVKDGEAHALLIDLARAEGRPLTEVRAILDAGRAIDPSYVWLYSAMAEYLLPRWYGKLGDIEKFAAEVVQMLPGEDGLDAYGHIAYIVNQYDANVLFWGGYDRELLVKGAEVLVKRYPTGTNVVPFAAMCTMAAQDQGAARRIRPLVSSSDAPRVKVWRYVAADYFRWCDADEAASGRCKWLWGMPLNYGNVVFSSDSQSVWCTSGLGRSAAVQFDVQTGEVKRAYSGLSNQIYAVAPEPQEKWLIGVLAGPDFQGWVRWNLPGEGEEMRHPTKESCSAIALNPVKDQIAWAESKTVRTFDLETQKAGPQIELTKTVERLKFSADGKRLAISAGSISIWDAATGKRRYSLPDFSTQPRGKIACEHLVDFDDEGRVWATAFVFGAKPPQRPLLRFAADGKKWDTVVPNLNGLPASAVLSADRRCLAIAENNEGPGGAESIQIWDLQTQQLQMRLPGHHNHIASLCFSPDGKHLASAGRLGGPIKIWSLEAKAKRETGPAKKGAPL